METIETWLKTTVFGILTLSIVGSIIAYYIVKYAAFIFRRVLPAPFRLFVSTAKKAGVSHALAENEMIQEGKVIQLVSYLVSRSVRWLTLCIFANTCFVLSYHEFTRTGGPLFSSWGFTLFIVGVNLIQLGRLALTDVTDVYKKLVRPILTKHAPKS